MLCFIELIFRLFAARTFPVLWKILKGCAVMLRRASWNVAGTSFLDLFDKIASCYMLPLGGLCTALVFGWAISNEQKKSEIGSSAFSTALLFAAKYISPVLLLLVFLKEIGLF